MATSVTAHTGNHAGQRIRGSKALVDPIELSRISDSLAMLGNDCRDMTEGAVIDLSQDLQHGRSCINRPAFNREGEVGVRFEEDARRKVNTQRRHGLHPESAFSQIERGECCGLGHK
jgi:hypothetical protein